MQRLQSKNTESLEPPPVRMPKDQGNYRGHYVVRFDDEYTFLEPVDLDEAVFGAPGEYQELIN